MNAVIQCFSNTWALVEHFILDYQTVDECTVYNGDNLFIDHNN